MIFATLNQLNLFITFVFFGILVGLLSSIFYIIFLKNYQKNIIKIVFDSIFYANLLILFIFFINLFNFGEFSITLLFAYFMSIFYIQILTKKSVVFLETKWYNLIKRSFKRKQKNERELRKS